MERFQAQSTLTVGNGPQYIAVGDFNFDGFPDLVVTNYTDSTVSVLLSIGLTAPGSFNPQKTYPAPGSHPRGLAIADVNGDGTPDLVVANYSGASVSVLAGNSFSQTFGQQISL